MQHGVLSSLYDCSKAQACSRLFAAIAASNPTEESDVRFSCFLCVV